VTVDGFTFFPYTANNFYADPQDPNNLLFTGNVDPRQIRAALLACPTATGAPSDSPTPSRSIAPGAMPSGETSR
jgi:hypothetical protein